MTLRPMSTSIAVHSGGRDIEPDALKQAADRQEPPILCRIPHKTYRMSGARHDHGIGAVPSVKLLIFSTILLLWGVLPGCLGGTPPARTYFALQYPTDGVQRYADHKYPVILRIRPFTATVAYDKQEIVYRTSPYEFQYYWFKLWAAKPKRMLEELTGSYLRDARLFQEVIKNVTTRAPELDLECEVLAIEELDSTESTWFARLSLRYSLVRTSNRVVLWEYEFDEKKPVYNHTPAFVVKAMTELFTEQLGKMTDAMDAYLESGTAGIEVRPVTRLAQPQNGGPKPLGSTEKHIQPDDGPTSEPEAFRAGDTESLDGEPKPKAVLRR